MKLSMPGISGSHLSTVHYGFENLITRRWHQGRADSTPIRRDDDSQQRAISGIRVAVAQSKEHIEAAAALVRQRYSWRGYGSDKNANHEVATTGHPRQEITFIAVDDLMAHGTITVGLDSTGGLLAEETHSEAIRARRASGRRVCEFTRLAVAKGKESRDVLAPLFSLAYTAARTLHGAHDVFIEVNPRHVDFYQRILGFEVASDERFCERVGAPSVLLCLDFDVLEERLRLIAMEAIAEPLLAEAA